MAGPVGSTLPGATLGFAKTREGVGGRGGGRRGRAGADAWSGTGPATGAVVAVEGDGVAAAVELPAGGEAEARNGGLLPDGVPCAARVTGLDPPGPAGGAAGPADGAVSPAAVPATPVASAGSSWRIAARTADVARSRAAKSPSPVAVRADVRRRRLGIARTHAPAAANSRRPTETPQRDVDRPQQQRQNQQHRPEVGRT